MSIDNGAAPEYGAAVERAVCDLEGLEHTDGVHADALDDDGNRVQIKGTRRYVSNGDGRARGRFAVWSETLTTFVYDNDVGGTADSRYILAVYDAEAFTPGEDDIEDIDPDEFIEDHVYATTEQISEAAGDSWREAHRPSKGKRGRFRWTDIEALADSLDAEAAEEREEAAA